MAVERYTGEQRRRWIRGPALIPCQINVMKIDESVICYFNVGFTGA